jgi:hypothetical protein
VRQTLVGTDQSMYYDASSSDYISTPSFAIPNTGIITIEAWMNSKLNTAIMQTIVGDAAQSPTTGMILLSRGTNTYNLVYYYGNGTDLPTPYFGNFFLNLDNQWIHIVAICDYNNKTLKAYRNGVQFGATQNLTGTPVFPLTNRIKYVGTWSTGSYRFTDGSLDEVRIYSRGLGADEISAQYNITKSRYGH